MILPERVLVVERRRRKCPTSCNSSFCIVALPLVVHDVGVIYFWCERVVVMISMLMDHDTIRDEVVVQ